MKCTAGKSGGNYRGLDKHGEKVHPWILGTRDRWSTMSGALLLCILDARGGGRVGGFLEFWPCWWTPPPHTHTLSDSQELVGGTPNQEIFHLQLWIGNHNIEPQFTLWSVRASIKLNRSRAWLQCMRGGMNANEWQGYIRTKMFIVSRNLKMKGK